MKVNESRIEHVFSQRSLEVGVNTTKAIEECSSTGIDLNNLASCYHIATFFQCFFDKMHIQLSTIEMDFEWHRHSLWKNASNLYTLYKSLILRDQKSLTKIMMEKNIARVLISYEHFITENLKKRNRFACHINFAFVWKSIVTKKAKK